MSSPPGLALVGLAALDRGDVGWASSTARSSWPALVLSLGPTLPGLPLYQVLHRWLPLFGLIRNPEKLRILTSLGVAVLAGFGVHALVSRLSPRAALAAGTALVAALVAGAVPWHAIALTRFPETPVYGRPARRDASS